ncbi:hypothetical protein K493DRAFT_407949 [Basidiobolus meristosporus CBS 931.73]|uniref:Arrestin C-terminal-like domain-containing protein n=1 Tax=Basidiobolus meristosporus CBS 931.73 TaxID=1314790 RepID=A0A1Y1Y9D1_9FUNG|nr:hypothetical protein K493DRAFT_407949 [Basidiobolus meristosporus CBS 931.73]|eukprot:ORX94588.1 hypothetical protein K493DRAFT_407949 [Basidiobolus meristosporus CBS 931.73]
MLRSLVKFIFSKLATGSDDLNSKDSYMLRCLFSAIKSGACYPAPPIEDTPRKQPLDIRLTSNLLTLYGRPEDSAGVVLRGTVFVNRRRPFNVKSITVIFKGTFSIHSPIDQICREKTIIESHTSILTTSVDAQILDAQSQFDFELPLNGDLPSSIHTKIVNIRYQVIGVIERPFLFKNIVAHSPVSIQRSTVLENFEVDASTSFSGVWASRLCYDVFTTDLTFVIGDPIQLSFKLFALKKCLNLHYVQLVLEEKILYQEEELLFPTPLKKTVAWTTVDCPDPRTQCWEETVSLTVPNDAHEDCESAILDISHKLIVSFAVSGSDVGKNIIYGQIPIKLMSSTQAEASTPLPLYEPLPHFLQTNTLQQSIMNMGLPSYDYQPPPKYTTSVA